MGDEPDKSEASTAGGTEGGDASKAESGAAGDADAGGAQTKVVLAAVVGIVVTIVIIIVLLIPKGSATGTTTPKVEEAASNKTGNSTVAPSSTKATPAPDGKPDSHPGQPETPDTPDQPVTKETIPKDFVACVSKECTDTGKLTDCTDIIVMNDDPDISTFKANKATDKRHYIGFEFKVLKKMQPNDLTSTLQGSLTNGYAVLGVDPSEGDVESTLKKLDAKKLLIVSIPYVKDIEKSQDKITALKADLIVLETHMKKPTGDGPLAPSVWVTAPTGVSATATFADVKATLQKLQDGKVHFSISASVAVFEYTSTVAVDAANLFTQTMTGSEGQALFEETGCEQRIEETNHNIAVVEDKTKMKLQVYENDATLKAKVDAATATPTDVPGWTLFDVMCKKSPTPSECPMRYENPVDVIKTKDDWTKTPSGGTPTVVEAPNIPIFCVVKPDTSCTATTAMSFSNCDGVMYYDPAWDMASDPTDALYAAVHTKAANDDKYYIGVSYGKLDLDKIPVDFKSIALMDIDSETTTATDVNTKLTDAKVQSLKRAVGIIGEKELDKWMADTEKGVYIILQTITKPPTTPCQVMPTSPWKADLTKAAATITSRKGVALSLTLEGITYTITTPSATDAAAVADEVLNSATLTACTAAVDADMSNNCASSADNTDKDNSVSLDTAKTAATVFESKDSITAKKTIWKTPWAVFWTACKARSTDCQAVDDLVKVLK